MIKNQKISQFIKKAPTISNYSDHYNTVLTRMYRDNKLT